MGRIRVQKGHRCCGGVEGLQQRRLRVRGRLPVLVIGKPDKSSEQVYIRDERLRKQCKNLKCVDIRTCMVQETINIYYLKF